jgi:hypothetical protein
VRLEKPVVVFFGPRKSFVNVRTRDDVVRLLEECGGSVAARFEKELDLDRPQHHGDRLI